MGDVKVKENMREASLDGQDDEFRFRNVKDEVPVRYIPLETPNKIWHEVCGS